MKLMTKKPLTPVAKNTAWPTNRRLKIQASAKVR